MTFAEPYCGFAPAPAELAGRWNFDPVVLASLVGVIGAWAYWRRTGGQGDDRLAAAAGAILIVAFVSPLCALASALFSARVVHHALLVVVAAPLVVFAPTNPWRAPPLAVATLAHVATFWLWHTPGPYAWALSSDMAYGLMQASLLGAAIGFWLAVRRASALSAVAALLAFMLQMGLLGALITFAPEPLYIHHIATTLPWGLTPLEDQQLAGLIMWAPMALIYMLAALALLAQVLQPARPRETV